MAQRSEQRDLVVGGTGMLAGVCESLAGQGRTVSVLGRRHGPMAALRARCPADRIDPILVDYTDHDALTTALDIVQAHSGPFDRSICWAHEPWSRRVTFEIARRTETVLCQVLGSAVADPSDTGALLGWQRAFADAAPHLDHRIVILGFVIPPLGPPRWLTHPEICSGVLAALRSGAAVSVVGTVEPWEVRP